MATPLLSYALTPTSIDYSVPPDGLSVVSLTITATNSTNASVACSRLDFSILVGDSAESLTADPTSIAAAPGPSTPWAISSLNGRWTAVPVPPVTSIPPGSSVQFVLSDVVVNSWQGNTALTITETTSAVATTSVSVSKDQPAPVGTVPNITSFTADPAVVAEGGTTTLSWSVENAGHIVLLPGPTDLPNTPTGSVPCPVSKTTTFTLQALGSGGTASAAAVVTVGPVSILSFTASPAGPVAPGNQVTFDWTTQNAGWCSIDQGIGPVTGTSMTIPAPTQTTVYTLSAHGLEPKSASVEVQVTRS